MNVCLQLVHGLYKYTAACLCISTQRFQAELSLIALHLEIRHQRFTGRTPLVALMWRDRRSEWKLTRSTCWHVQRPSPSLVLMADKKHVPSVILSSLTVSFFAICCVKINFRVVSKYYPIPSNSLHIYSRATWECRDFPNIITHCDTGTNNHQPI